MRSLPSCLKTLWSMSKSVRWRMVVKVAVGLVRIAASLGFVIASKHLVDIATGVSSASMGRGIALFAGILLLQILSGIFISWWDSYSNVKARNMLRRELFGHVMRSDWSGRERYLSGDIVNRLNDDTRIVSDLLTDSIPNFIITLLQLIAASAYLLTMAPNLLWVLIVLMLAAVLCSKMFFRKLRELMARVRARESELQQLTQESLQHRVLVLTLSRVERILDKFGWMQSDIESNTRKRLSYNAVARGLMSFGFGAGYAAAFLWGVLGIAGGTVTYGMMTAFLQLVGQVQRPIASLGQQIPAFIRTVTSVDRLMDLQELEEEPEGEQMLLDGAPEVVVANLSYSYPGEGLPVLKDFSCRFSGGSFTVVAGPTGIGKSTLTYLILGLLKPTSGYVTVGGYPAGGSVRCNFMYVPQGISLLSGTIRSNLLMANPSADEAQMRDVLDRAMAGFVFDLPAGLDTPCGEKGSGLSEGQAQRIAIARALLRPGGILILDEATSALDAATEEQLLENLYRRCHSSKTVICITHRSAATRFADAVVTL